jgi:hypothetical protein
VARGLFFFPSFLWFFRFNFGCSLKNFRLVCTPIFQWLQWFLGSLYWCVMDFIFLPFPSFHFFFPSLKSSWFSFYLELLGFPFSWHNIYIYCAFTHSSSSIFVFKRITFFNRCLCIPFDTWGVHNVSWERYLVGWQYLWTHWFTHVHSFVASTRSIDTRYIGPIYT